ncbi:MAG: signal peptidase I [Eggerthellaceae bacterium]|nr:signal peptidase I [Eggerthellaceae bacterium]
MQVARAAKIAQKVLGGALILLVISSFALASLTFAPSLVGISPYVVTSRSMEPSIQQGSLAFANTGVTGLDIQEGDAIAFSIDGTDGEVCVHRAHRMDMEGGAVITKGDANEVEDLDPVPFARVLGRVDASIPKVGYLLVWACQNKLALISASAVIALAFAALSCVSSMTCKDKTEREGEGYDWRMSKDPKRA